MTTCYQFPVYKRYGSDTTLFNNDVELYSQGYDQIKVAFGALRKDDILQPYISDHDYRSTNVNDAELDNGNVGLYVFDLRHKTNFTVAQPIKVESKFDGVVPNNINGDALALTNTLISTSSDGQRLSDLL